MMSIQLEFLGAAGTVTGSKTLLRCENRNYLIDCGLFQGPKELRLRNWEKFPIDPASIETVFLTHAHLDHCGYLPRLQKQGFRGSIYCSPGTADLCSIMLLDAAKIQEEDADFANQTRHSKHVPALPLFNVEDAEAVLKLIKVQPQDHWLQVSKDLSVRYLRSGHIIGSSFIQFSIGGSNRPRLLTFSGDIGHHRSLILKGPVDMTETDALVLESTYGDRGHSREDVSALFVDICRRVFERKGILMIPAFAVGRTQEILFLIRSLEAAGRIPAVPVVLDSPMANAATDVFLKHPEDHLLDTMFLKQQLFPKHFEYAATPDESMVACMREGPMIVIAGAGMLNGGRMLHHLKRRLPKKENLVLFVGYQAEGSKGRFLQENAKSIGTLRIHHQEISVEAEIATLPSLSAHGDSEDILEWLSHFKRAPLDIFLNHGSPESSGALATKIHDSIGIVPRIVAMGEKCKLW